MAETWGPFTVADCQRVQLRSAHIFLCHAWDMWPEKGWILKMELSLMLLLCFACAQGACS